PSDVATSAVCGACASAAAAAHAAVAVRLTSSQGPHAAMSDIRTYAHGMAITHYYGHGRQARSSNALLYAQRAMAAPTLSDWAASAAAAQHAFGPCVVRAAAAAAATVASSAPSARCAV